MPKTKMTQGETFNRLTALGPSRPGYWLFQCQCGNVKEIQPCRVSSGAVKSCGCLCREILLARNVPTHGGSKSRLYSIWRGMKKRCGLPSAHAYENYGGRGIHVCSEWENSFPAFRDWAMANGYRDDLTVDRIDSNGNYCPENCRWVDMVTQERNRRNVRKFLFAGQLRPLTEICEMTGIPYSLLYKRVVTRGWPIERALLKAAGRAV